jgi:N-acyl-L-homoserine lactone synthetase
MLDAMFHDRAHIFGPDGLNWEVEIDEDGGERDQFDAAPVHYVIVCDKAHQYRGSLRLIPTVSPHMMTDVFGIHDLAGRDTLEMSRLCAHSRDTLDDLVKAARAYGVSHGFDRIVALIRPGLTGLVTKRYGGKVLKQIKSGVIVEFRK